LSVPVSEPTLSVPVSEPTLSVPSTFAQPITIKKDSLILMCKSVGILASNKNKKQLTDELGNIVDIIINQLNLREIKDICKIESIKGYSKMRKDEAVILLLEYFFPDILS